mmetsp:Transcript_10066/g.36776  ORF Transcript_10066/g.36776 Transcript_10066/m.36776 type:complete len:1049 (+) Transcript_10066:144-3290(+)
MVGLNTVASVGELTKEELEEEDRLLAEAAPEEEAEEEEGAADEGKEEADTEDEAFEVEEGEEDEEEDQAGKHLRSPSKKEVVKAERRRLKELAKKKKEMTAKMLEEQNAEVAQEGKGKTRLKYLLKQTDVFAHFMNSEREPTVGPKKGKSKKMTEEEEDAMMVDGDVNMPAETRITVQPKNITGQMREYQIQGLNWLVRCYDYGINGILADEMGLGKTLQTISLLGYLREFRGLRGPHLILAPKSTIGNWMREINRWCPEIAAVKLLGNQEERAYQTQELIQPGKFDAVVTSYEMVIKEKSHLKKFNWLYVIIDEAHRIKNENSVLSRTVRMLRSNYRLLITGTPLQNNLHELWALLNFLLPEVFKNAQDFDEWFQIDGEDDQGEVVQQLHKVLRPFLLRRLKSEVERGMPPKKETILQVGMSAMQKDYYRKLLQKDIDVVNSGGERSRLLNIAMQLRKCCNHPYLFQGAEPGPPFITGEHLVDNAGKMVLLDKLLPKLKERESRVLIFSQMTRMLDILEDYCLYRSYQYCRIDGNTSGDDRDSQIEAFNSEGSEKFIFMLSTRAGGLGINLATADVVVLYDSDWNPQMDLQAMDRAHRIGQKKEVQVFRFCTEGAIEEKVIEKAYKKLALDALVVQQGRLTESKTSVNKEELLQMVRYGAEQIFSSKDSTITADDIDVILARGAEKQDALNEKMRDFSSKAMQFSMDGEADLYEFEEEQEPEDNEPPDVLKAMIAANWIDPPKRERKRNYNEQDYFRSLQSQSKSSKPKEPRLPRMPVLNDYQFYNVPRVTALFEKENAYIQWKHTQRDNEDAEGGPPPLSEEEQAEKEELLQAGFANWNRRDFNAFVRACEKYGRDDIESITAELGLIESPNPKTEEDVAAYSKVFWDRMQELNDWERILKNIEKGEQRIQRKLEIQEAIQSKLQSSKNPWRDLKIQYGQNKGKAYTEEEDRFLLCMMHQLGYGAWDELKLEIRKSWMFRFDWFFKSRTPQELQRRCDTLIRLVEKEIEENEPASKKGKKANGESKSAGKRKADSVEPSNGKKGKK